MAWIAVCVIVVAIVGAGLWWRQRELGRKLIEEHTIEPERLHELLAGEQKPRVFDVRLPLDLLVHSEIIPGSVRVAPKEIEADPTLIPKDEVAVVYCTCPGDETARMILKKALKLDFVHACILRGGLEAWKAKGYPVERYTTAFHLDTPA